MAMAKSVAASALVPFIARIDDRSDRYLGGVTRSAARPIERAAAADPSGDDWFRALDAHRVMLGLLSWHVEVFSSMVCDDARWLQLALVGPARFMLTMRIPELPAAGNQFSLYMVKSAIRLSITRSLSNSPISEIF